VEIMANKLKHVLTAAVVCVTTLLSGFSEDARALACTPGVAINSSGFTLGCATPALWSVLSINYDQKSDVGIYIKNDSGTFGSTAGMEIGVYGGKIATDSTITTADFNPIVTPPVGLMGDKNIAVTDGVYPSTIATSTTGISNTSPGRPSACRMNS